MLNSITRNTINIGTDSTESLENIFSSYAPGGLHHYELPNDFVLEGLSFKEPPEIIEELVVVSFTKSESHPVLLKPIEQNKRQKLFALYKSMSGRFPTLASVRLLTETRGSVTALSMKHDFYDEEDDNLPTIEVKRYEFTFTDMKQYQQFILEVSPYVSFFRMPKSKKSSFL
jgi:hypothetical protein